jgi:hypothetical protein
MYVVGGISDEILSVKKVEILNGSLNKQRNVPILKMLRASTMDFLKMNLNKSA